MPRSAADLEARPPGGGRESDHPNQQEHDASYKEAPVPPDDSPRTFVEESEKSPWITQHSIPPSDLPQGKLFRRETLRIDTTKMRGSLARAFLCGRHQL
jgi:hypothetical protein